MLLEAKNVDRPVAAPNRATGTKLDQTVKVTLIIVDPRCTIRACLAAWVAGELPEVSVVEIGNVDELSRRMAPAGAVIVLLSFAAGPGRNPKAEQAAWRVRNSFAEGKLVFLCDDVDQANLQAAVRCGAVGFIDTMSGPAVLAHCLRFVIVGGTALPSIAALPDAGAKREEAATEPAPAERYPRFSADLFTAKELDVLRCLGAGKPNKIIAYELNICETTVKVHMRHIMQKLGANNRTHAAMLAVDLLS